MAEDTVDAVLRYLGRSARCRTRRLPLHGAQGFAEPAAGDPMAHLAHRYGSTSAEVQALIARSPALAEHLIDGLPFVAAEAVYAVTDEMATTLDDVLTRRIPARLFERSQAERAARRTADLIAPLLGWDSAETERQVADFLERCAAEQRAAAGAGSVVER
jgi:glycerol-3-phosphate dehydrogenase